MVFQSQEDGDVFKELETFFGAADKVVVKPKEEKKKGPQIVTLLDGKRANNISIMLAQVRAECAHRNVSKCM